MPSHVTALAGSGLVAGRTTFVPVDVGPRPLDVAELVVNCSTAEAGGATRTVLAVYPHDGTGGSPDCSTGPLVSGPVALPTRPRADVGCGTDGGGVVVGIRAR